MTTPVHSDHYGQSKSNSGSSSSANRTVAAIILVGFVVLIVLVKGIRSLCRSHDHHQDQVGEGEGSSSPSGGTDPRAASSAELQAAGRVVCMYRRGAGGQDATCPVCLSDFADGEAVSVLPACMHYYHPACIDEWLRARATCPLCRAAPASAV